MDKIREIITNRGYVKYYDYGQIVVPINFLEELQNKGLKVNKVFMKRDSEMDMQMGTGEYTIEDLKKQEHYFLYGSACKFTLQTEIDDIPVEINFRDDSKVLYMVTFEKDLELSFLYEKKTRGINL